MEMPQKRKTATIVMTLRTSRTSSTTLMSLALALGPGSRERSGGRPGGVVQFPEELLILVGETLGTVLSQADPA
jgi:hypothetical protein